MFNSPLEQFQILSLLSFGMNLFDSSITNAMVTTWLGFSFFGMGGDDLVILKLIRMFNSPLEQFPVLDFFFFGMNLFDSLITNAMVTTWLGFSIFCMDGIDLVIMFIIHMFNSPLEQFQILPLLSFGMNLFDSSITNAMVTTCLGFSFFSMDGDDSWIKKLIRMFNSLLEEFEILRFVLFLMYLKARNHYMVKNKYVC